MSRGTDETQSLVLSEEQLRAGAGAEQLSEAGAVKHLDTERVSARVQRGSEHADLDRVEVADAAADSGEVETLPDGSISIPVFEEQLVVTKRLVVRERVIVRKHTVYEDHVVSTDLKRERLEVTGEGDGAGHDESEKETS